jgi:ribosomal 50S subunit-recycling heat shock protein
MATVARFTASLLLLSFGVGGFFALGTAKVEKRRAFNQGPTVVDTVAAVAHEEGIEFEVDGVVVPFRQIAVAAEVEGRVEFKAEECRKGRAVKEGDLLLRIDQRNYQLTVVRLNEELKQSEAMIDELKLESDNAGNQIELTQQQLEIDVRELVRNEDLAASGALSESEVDQVRRAELATRNLLQGFIDQKNLLNRRQIRLESAKALVQAQLDQAELDLTRTEIRAPLDGIIVSENVEQDGYVQKGNTVIELQGSSRLDVTCKLRGKQMHWLWQGSPRSESSSPTETQTWRAYDFPETPATVIYELGSVKFAWNGVLNRYDGPGFDDQTRMVPCRVHVSNPLETSLIEQSGPASAGAKPPTLMTGMFVKVRIQAKPSISLVRIDQRSLQPGNMIWTEVDGSLVKKQLHVAHTGDGFVLAHEEEGGLQPGDHVVVSILAAPSEGLTVKERENK